MNLQQRILVFFQLLYFAAFSQDVIFLENPSFEDSPQDAQAPVGWTSCGFEGETAVDVHPMKGGLYGVTRKPFDGLTYLGMVVRDNSTYEGVGQKLSSPLLPGQCYQFEINLCRSETYESFSRVTGKEANFSKPSTFVVMGGKETCERSVFLAKSTPVGHIGWKKYKILFQPNDTVSFLILEAYYLSGDAPPYNGNLLADNASPIIRIDCQSYEPVVDPTTVVPPRFKRPKRNYSVEIVHPPEKKTSGFEERIFYHSVSTTEELVVLLQKNCPSILFPEGQSALEEPAYNALREVAYNVKQFPYLRLVIFLKPTDKALVKQRIRAITEEFKIMRLHKKQYYIITKNPPTKEEGLLFENDQMRMGLQLG